MDKLYSSRRVIREAVNLGSDYATQIYRGFVDSFLNPPPATLDQWRLVKLEMLENGYFEEEFAERRAEFTRQGLAQEELSTHYGFLAASSEELVDLTLREGLKVRFCPINSLGYCIAGVHLCVHGDVCLQEAALETGDDGEQIVLVTFKFMFGRTKRVNPVTPKDMTIVAPSPGFHCHIADVRPSRTDSVSDQYLRSLAYLYEFENSFYHPVPRPRQCSPLAALYLRRRRGSGCPPKPPQFLPTAGRFPSAALTTSLSSTLLMPMSALVTAGQSTMIGGQLQQPLMRLTPDVASAVGSVLSELKHASTMAAGVMRQQQQQQPPPPKLDGIRGFLKNASGSTVNVQQQQQQQHQQQQQQQHQRQQQSQQKPPINHYQSAPAPAQTSKKPPPPPLLTEPPRRNAFLAGAAGIASSGEASVGPNNRFHPYARIQQTTTAPHGGESSGRAVNSVGRKSGFGVGGAAAGGGRR